MYVPKITITQNNIYVVWQFAYIHEVVLISLFSRKNTRYCSIIFHLSIKHLKPQSEATIFIFHKITFIIGQIIIRIKYN